MPLLVLFCLFLVLCSFCGVSSSDGGCKCKSYSVLSLVVVNSNLDVEAIVEVMAMGGPMDKFQFAFGCDN